MEHWMVTTVGVYGSGKSTRKHTAALLNDWTEDKSVSIVVSGREDDFTDAARHAADWALSTKVPLVIVIDANSVLADLEDYQGEPLVTVSEVSDATKYVLTKVKNLFLAWDEDDEEASERAANTAGKAGVPMFDLTDGLVPIGWEDDGEPESGQEEPSEAPAPDPEPEAASAPEEPAQPQDEEVPADEAQAGVVATLFPEAKKIKGSPVVQEAQTGVDEEALRRIVREELRALLSATLNAWSE